MIRNVFLSLAAVTLFASTVADPQMQTVLDQLQALGPKPLSKPAMEWFFKHYLRSAADARDPRINLVDANLKGLPPAIVITDQIDPLRSEGAKLAEKPKAAGVGTTASRTSSSESARWSTRRM